MSICKRRFARRLFERLESRAPRDFRQGTDGQFAAYSAGQLEATGQDIPTAHGGKCVKPSFISTKRVPLHPSKYPRPCVFLSSLGGVGPVQLPRHTCGVAGRPTSSWISEVPTLRGNAFHVIPRHFRVPFPEHFRQRFNLC